jgi:hypothetical protein
MSAQGATLRRGTVHIPIWPVAVVVLAATAVVIGLSTLGTDTIAPARPVTIVTDAERLANSSAAIREQGAVAPVAVGISHVAPSTVGFAGFENPGAYGISQVTEATHPVGLENPGAYSEAGSESDAGFAPTMGARPGMAGDEICGQCR